MTFNDSANVGGSCAQPERWFTTGCQNGPSACTTFTVSGGDL